MKLNIIHNEDCLSGMQSLPNGSINICTTSPPYNLNIKYSKYTDNQPRDQYLKWLNDIFVEIKRVLADDGHFWLNMGYSNVDPWVGMDAGQLARKHFELQNNFIWVKSIAIGDTTSGHFKPINSDRFANPTWEHLFHFTKTGKIRCDKLAVGVPFMWDCNTDRSGRFKGRQIKKLGFKNARHFNNTATEDQKIILENVVEQWKINNPARPNVRCKGNSLFIPYDTITDKKKHRGNHPATFPIQLIDHCIKFSGLKSGILLDPFMGSGTSAIAAIYNSLDYIGFDIDQDYIDFATDRIQSIQ